MAATNVRRLAAVDMYGTAGTRRRRRIIVIEFIVGVLAGPALGARLLSVATGPEWLAGWLIGIGVNYVPLAIHALALSRPGALDRELAGVDVGRELRRYGVAQLWILVPFLVAIVALFQVRRQPATGHR